MKEERRGEREKEDPEERVQDGKNINNCEVQRESG